VFLTVAHQEHIIVLVLFAQSTDGTNTT
jgi:hypothetical protein